MLGKGILKGLRETARNFFGSYVWAERLTTVEYPEERLPPQESARQFPFLVYDGEDPMAGLRCVACQICEKECPPQCIYIVKDKAKKADHLGKAQFQPAIFDIDISVCMSCQICVEVCPFDAIMMDVEFELSTSDRFAGLLLHKEHLVKPNAYFHAIHPADASRIDAQRVSIQEKMGKKAGLPPAPKAGIASPSKGEANPEVGSV